MNDNGRATDAKRGHRGKAVETTSPALEAGDVDDYLRRPSLSISERYESVLRDLR